MFFILDYLLTFYELHQFVCITGGGGL